MPKVSIIIPNFNHARYLEQRLRSVLDQTYSAFEVLFLDDASTDNSLEVLAQFESDPRLRTYHNETNSGSPYIQWNRGVSLAQGEYVWIAESDDYAAPALLERLVSVLDAHPEVGLAYCQSQRVAEDGAPMGLALDLVQDLGPEHWGRDFVRSGRDECAEYLVARNTIPNASAVVFRRAIYTAAGAVDETMRLAGDWLHYARMLKISDIAFVAEPLNHFRAHPASTRHTTLESGIYLLENYQVMGYILQEFEVTPAARKRALNSQMNAWVNHLVWKRRPLSWVMLRRIHQAALAADPHPLARFGRNAVWVPVQEMARRLTNR